LKSLTKHGFSEVGILEVMAMQADNVFFT